MRGDIRDIMFNKKDEDTLRRSLAVFVHESHATVFDPALSLYAMAAKSDEEFVFGLPESHEVTFMMSNKQFTSVKISRADVASFAGTRADVLRLFPDAADQELGRLTFRLWLVASLSDERLRDFVLELSFSALEILTVNFPSFLPLCATSPRTRPRSGTRQ
jgi:hypothetical protein